MAQPQNRVSRHLELAGVLLAYILASVKRAPRRRPVPQGRPGVDRIHPRAGTALAPPLRHAGRTGAL